LKVVGIEIAVDLGALALMACAIMTGSFAMFHLA
jgi:hypothetical protein